MKKTIVTVVGKDKVGIIASICSFLADSSVNVCDISQTIVNGFFNMMMIVDIEKCSKDFATFASELEQIGEEMSCIIKAQREDIFDKMHRI